jgi:hypothetical protein
MVFRQESDDSNAALGICGVLKRPDGSFVRLDKNFQLAKHNIFIAFT